MKEYLSISHKEMLNRFYYNPETGFLYRKWKRYGLKKVGEFSGNRASHTSLLGSLVYVHRICWFLFYKKWPNGIIDHINGDPKDNRIVNLRDVTFRENSNNLKIHRDGKLIGAHWHKNDKKWYSKIQKNGKNIHLGCFPDQKSAHKRYLEAKRILESGIE